MKTRTLHRALSMLLTAAMVMNIGLTPVFAEGVTPPGVSGVCTHHTEHTEDCGYQQGTPCNHAHTEGCYKVELTCPITTGDTAGDAPEVATDSDADIDSNAVVDSDMDIDSDAVVDSGNGSAGAPHTHGEDCFTKTDNCTHIHDETCGYTPDSPCTYDTASCTQCSPGDKPAEKVCTCEPAISASDAGHDEDCPLYTKPVCTCPPVDSGEPVHGMGCPLYTTPALSEAVKALIAMVDALPNAEDITEDNKEATLPAFDAALTAYEALSVDDKAAFESTEQYKKLMELHAVLYSVALLANSPVELDITGGDNYIEITSTGYKIGANPEISYTGAYIISGTTTETTNTKVNHVLVSGGTHDITLKNVSIDLSERDNGLPFLIDGSSTVNLTLEGDNKLNSGWSKAALLILSGTLTITKTSTGSLTAIGGKFGAGIGAGSGTKACIINIGGGTIIATGGERGAGIGGGSGAQASIINISGGTIIATGGKLGAGIGGGNIIQGSGHNITITGGTVTATGGENGAGIGSGADGKKGTITISGGTVTATGGSNGAGIGGAQSDGEGKDGNKGGTITITGGTIKASGGYNSAGIGGGRGGTGDNITISGGNIKASGGYYAAAIGGGVNGAGGNITINGGTINAVGGDWGAGIGGGDGGEGGNITIGGGTIMATSGNRGAGIGGGTNGAGGNIKIQDNAIVFTKIGASSPNYIGAGKDGSAGTISKNNSIIFESTMGKMYGDVTLGNNVTIADEQILFIESGSTLTIPSNVTLQNDGKIYNKGGTVSGTVSGNSIINESANTHHIDLGSLTIDDSTCNPCGGHEIVGSTTKYRVIVNGGTHNITLKDASIDMSAVNSHAFEINNTSTVNLTLTGTNTLKGENIYAGLHVPNGTTLTITEASTGSLTAVSKQKAGIGGADSTCGTITINGGTVNATGYMGIGSGSNGGDITITGGTVTATSTSTMTNGVGINSTGAVNITGGTVTATATQPYGGIGINAATITINGDTVVYAKGTSPSNGGLHIKGSLTKTKGVIFEGSSGAVYGNSVKMGQNFTIANDETLTIGRDSTLEIDSGVTLQNNGTIQLDGNLNGTGTLAGEGTFKASLISSDINPIPDQVYTGKAIDPHSYLSDTTRTIMGKSFDISLSEYKLTCENNVKVGTAKAILTKMSDANIKAETTFKIVKADSAIGLTTDKTDNKVTYGDTIKFTAEVSIPATKARSAAANTVDFYCGDTKLNDSAIALTESGGTGSATFAYDTTGKKIPAGTQTITAQYGGGSNLNGVTQTVNVTVNPKSLTATVKTGDATTSKVYDSNANFTGVALTLTGLKAEDNGITATASGTAANANVDTSKAFTATNATLAGTGSTYYSIAASAITGNVTITTATPSVSVTAVKKVSRLRTILGDHNDTILLTATTGGVNGEKPNGSVTFKNGAATLATVSTTNGIATYDWANPPAGNSITITVDFTASDTNYSSTPVTGTANAFDIGKGAQSALTVNVPTLTYGDSAFTLTTSGGNGSGAVSFTSSDPTTVSISGNTATIHKAGNVTITANKAADDSYNEVTATASLTVNKKAISFIANDMPNVVKGSQMPVFTYKPVTLATGDNMITEPTLATTVADTKTLGKFAITISGAVVTNADSYTITYVNGEMTVVEPLYTVTVTDGTGGGQYSEGQTVSITANSKSGYTFSSWSSSDGVTFADSNAKTTTFTMLGKNVTVKANYNQDSTGGGGSTGGGSTGGGGSSGDDNSTGGGNITPPANSEPPSTAETDAKTNADQDGNVTAKVDDKDILKAIEKAQKSEKQNGIAITLNVKTKENTNALEVTLSASTISALTNAKVTQFTINNGLTTITLDLTALNALKGGDVILSVSKVDVKTLSAEAQNAIGNRPVFRFGATVGGKAVTDFRGGRVGLQMPYTRSTTEQAGNLCAVYVDGNGKLTWLENSSYESITGMMLASTSHFSIYGVGYKQSTPNFTDVGTHWARNDIDFVVARGLLTGTSNTTFAPDQSMTRGMFVTALGRLAGVDTKQYNSTKFTDVKADAYYAPYVAWASANNIVTGTSDTTFSPDKAITRQEMAVMLVNYSKTIGYKLPSVHAEVSFVDAGSIANWAKDAVKQMQMAGILMGKSGNRFDSTATATRAEVSAMLRRYVELVVNTETAEGWAMNESGQWMYIENGKRTTGKKTIDGTKYTFNQFGVTTALPPERKYLTHIVQKGESFWSIARKYKVSMFELAKVNGKTIFSVIRSNEELRIPHI